MSWIKSSLETIRDNSSSKNKQRQFGILVVLFLLLICCVSLYKEGLVYTPKQISTAIGACIVLIAIFLQPIIFYPFLFIWLFIGNILGEISSFIILGTVYYFMLSPITFFLKLIHKKKESTGWMDKEESVDYEKLY